MKKIVLYINDLHTSHEVSQMVCYGLGSCIGLFIQDRALKITSGAHIAVVKSFGQSDYRSAEETLFRMFEELSDRGSSLKNLRAKLVGGASIYKSSYRIGEENTKAIRTLLIANKVFIAAQDTGGNTPRTAEFNCMTGECRVQTSTQQMYCI